MKRGMVESASSQRQPKVGITKMASRTSNTVPTAQNICVGHKRMRRPYIAYTTWNSQETHCTSISRMHVALDLMGRNSAYSVTLVTRNKPHNAPVSARSTGHIVQQDIRCPS